MQERYIASADLGSSKIGLSVAKVEGDNLQIIYYKETPSKGISYSYVRTPKNASEALREAVTMAEEELGIKILSLVVGLPRYFVRQEKASAGLERTDPSSCITVEEIELIKNEATNTFPLDPKAKEVIFAAVAQSFSADDEVVRANEEDVIGMPADVIEGHFKVFIGAQRALSNIDLMLNLAGYALAEKVFTPDAVAKAVLTDNEKENGVALIEFGAGATSVTIYKDKLLRHYSSIPFGSKILTTDIKYECGFDLSLCENIKLAYGACLPDKLLSLGEKVLQIQDEESGKIENLPVKYLSEIITCRAKEIVSAILYQIQGSGYADSLRSGVVITGGGAELVNLPLLIKNMSGYNVRVGYPRQQMFSVLGCQEVTNASAAASVGMILQTAKNPNINCISETPIIVKKKETEDSTDTIFTPEEMGANEVQEAKPKKQETKKKPGITWKLKKAFENTLGGFFDEME